MLEKFLVRKIWNELNETEKVLFETFSKKFIPKIIYKKITFEDFLFYLRLNVFSQETKNESLHLSIINMVEKKFKEFNEQAVEEHIKIFQTAR